MSSLVNVRALHSVYKFNRSAAQYLLLRAENAILEVPDDEDEGEAQPLNRAVERANEEEAQEPEPEPKDATANDERAEKILRRRPVNLNLNQLEQNWEDDFGGELPATPGGWDEQWT